MKQCIILSIFIFIGTVTLVGVFPLETLSQTIAPFCDPLLIPVYDEAFQYRERDKNRCEGLYQKEISGSLDLVRLVQGSFPLSLTQKERLTLKPAFPPPVSPFFYLRGVGIPLFSNYRLDAKVNLNSFPFHWNPHTIALRKESRLSGEQLGLYGWVIISKNKLYVPLRIEKESGPHSTSSETIILTVRANRDVENVMYRWNSTKKGRCTKLGKNFEIPSELKNRERYYYQGEGISIQIPASSTGGLCFQVAVEVADPADWLTTPIYHIQTGKWE